MSAPVVCPRCQAEYPEGTDRCAQDGSPLCDPEDIQRLGSRFNSYEITDIIGVGGMGVVYKGRHITLNKPVAIKILTGKSGRRSSAFSEMLREAQAASRIHHPHIVDITDFGTASDGAAFLVMEFLEGESLNATLMQRTRLPVARAIQIMIQITDALVAAHHQGIIHRDLKPENVFLVDVGRFRRDEGERPLDEQQEDFVKLLDFGLAKVQDMGPSVRTRSGLLAGTPYYMSPEQAQNDPVDGRSDIYSVGVLFYQMVTGHLPFTGDSALEVLMAHVSKPVTHPSRRCQAVDQRTEQIILRCLEKEADDRFQTMDELYAALQGHKLPGTEYAQNITAELNEKITPDDIKARSQLISNPTVSTELVDQVLRDSKKQVDVKKVDAPPRIKEISDRHRVMAKAGPATSRYRRLAIWSGAAAIVAVALFLLVVQDRQPPSRSENGADNRATIEVLLSGLPPGARAYLDGKETELPLMVPRSNKTHRLKIKADGFVPQEQTFVARTDVGLAFDLAPAPTARALDASLAQVQPDAKVLKKRPRPLRRRRPRPATAKAASGSVGDKASQPSSMVPAAKKELPRRKPKTVEPKPELPKTKPPPTKTKKYRDWVIDP